MLAAERMQVALSREVAQTLEVRGALEGVAARLATEQGVGAESLAFLRACVSGLDRLVQQSALSLEIFAEYARLNARFHGRILELAPYGAFFREPDGEAVTPFTIPDVLPLVQANLALFRKILLLEQEQHRSILEALERGQGARAEYLLREHPGIAARQLSHEART